MRAVADPAGVAVGLVRHATRPTTGYAPPDNRSSTTTLR